MFCDLILVAGGKSSRFDAEIPKQFHKVLGVPLYMWALETFLSWPSLGQTVFVVPEDWVEAVQKSFSSVVDSKPISVVSGGSSRRASCERGLKKLLELSNSNQWVAVHDAARPCFTVELLDEMFQLCLKNSKESGFGGVVPGVRPTSTIKEVNNEGSVVSTLVRENLRVIQTPQIVRKSDLSLALERFSHIEAVDDASLIEKLERRIVVVEGSYDNLKVTFNEDIERVSNWLRKRHP